MKKLGFAIMLASSTSLALPALAQTPTVQVEHAWARATSASQKVGGVFLTLTDTGVPDHLISASSPIADEVQVHETIDDAGVMKMRPVPSLALPTGMAVTLKPGGYHIMAIGLKQQLTPGSSFPITLSFEKSAPVTVNVMVEAAGASAPMMDHSHMPGGMMPPTKP
jgi:copper(I)-binding protein